MIESYPLSLALFDFIPNLLFVVGAFFLVRLAQCARGTTCNRLALSGVLLIAAGGLSKAIWKLLYTLQIADIQVLSNAQFVLAALGYLAVLMAAIQIARNRPGQAGAAISQASPLLAIALWKIPFLFCMLLASLGTHGTLTYVAFRRGVKWAAAGFILAMLCSLAMGGLAGSSQSLTLQWVAEGTNTLGQVGFALGSGLLYRSWVSGGG